MNRVYLLPLILLPLLSGCASSLTQWTDEQLNPYLAKELGQHPRFKNQPIQLVAMHGENVQSEIDQLSADIRNRVFERLVQTPGVNLIRHTANDNLNPSNTLSNLSCQPPQKLQYYIGFDIKANAGQYQFSVKALDIEQQNWVSGFGQTWTGSLNKAQQRALNTMQPDYMLLGSRALPFNAQQTDLIAISLAKQFNCLLKEHPKSFVRIFLNSQTTSSVLLGQLLQQTGHQISRLQEIALTDSPELANILLDLQVHPIKKDLQQLWLISKNKQNGQHIAGLASDVYINIPSLTVPEKIKPKHITLHPPITDTVSKGPKPETVKPKTITNQHPAKLFDTLKVIAPLGEPFCRTRNPWIMGEHSVNIDKPLPYCFGFKINTTKNTHLFILNSDPKGNFFRLPDESGKFKAVRLNANKNYRYPAGQLYNLDPALAYENMHLIVISDATTSNRFANLIANMQACCDANPANGHENWQEKLHNFTLEHQQQMDWRVLTLIPAHSHDHK